jgi:50S ribosomal protein L16 3-hydroxylase
MPAAHNSPLALLGGLSADQFLRDYWQKKPLLVRQAYQPGWITQQEVFGYGAADDIEARLVAKRRGRWHVSFGPQNALPREKRDWTLLVQGVNQRHRGAATLMQSLDFLPFWRLDDVMLSFAAPGGGVGPHVDSYDVFLLQVEGRRRWRISQQRDLSLVPGLPLKMLANFEATEEWQLEPGDMLYLPPQVAHEGVAVDACLTASIGFRAPHFAELQREFLHFAADASDLAGRYSDRGRKATSHPGELDDHLIEQACKRILAARFEEADVVQFLGSYLSEPKATVFFDAMPQKAWQQAMRRITEGVALDARSIMLYRGKYFFINGEELGATGAERRLLTLLADRRRLDRRDLQKASSALLEQLGEWLEAGWLNLESCDERQHAN